MEKDLAIGGWLLSKGIVSFFRKKLKQQSANWN